MLHNFFLRCLTEVNIRSKRDIRPCFLKFGPQLVSCIFDKIRVNSHLPLLVK